MRTNFSSQNIYCVQKLTGTVLNNIHQSRNTDKTTLFLLNCLTAVKYKYSARMQNLRSRSV